MQITGGARKYVAAGGIIAAMAAGGFAATGASQASAAHCNTDDVVRILERQTDILTEILISVKVSENAH